VFGMIVRGPRLVHGFNSWPPTCTDHHRTVGGL
jgi:hypothetical protein